MEIFGRSGPPGGGRRAAGGRKCSVLRCMAVVSVSVSSLALYLGTLAAARALHAALLAGVLHAPSMGFFDCTPVGRVLNRFSKDVDVLDNVLPMVLRGWTSCFFAVRLDSSVPIPT